MFDGDVNTYFHSGSAGIKNGGLTDPYVKVDFLQVQTVEEIVLDMRRDCAPCLDRYEMCFSLLRANGDKAAEKCTTDVFGNPFLIPGQYQMRVVFPDGVPDVETVRLDFKHYAQVAELNIYGHHTAHLNFLDKLPRVWAARDRNEHANGVIRNVEFHTCDDSADLYQSCVDHWLAWSSCTVTCGGGTKTRIGWIGGVQTTEDRPCNTEECPFDPAAGAPCSCSNGNKWMCWSDDCPARYNCQRTEMNSEDMYCVLAHLGQCSAWGDPHITTFDRAQNDVYGVATYTLVQPTATKAEMGDVEWAFTMETQGVGRVSVARMFELEVTIGDDESYKVRTYADKRIEYEWNIDGIDTIDQFEEYIHLRIGDWIHYDTPNGLRVQHGGYYFSVHVPYAYSQKTEGLCADYDFDKTNDYKAKDGTVYDYYEQSNIWDASDSEYQSAISWIIEGDPGVHPGTIDQDHQNCEHRAMCASMFDHAWLANCRAVVDTTPFIESCIVDYCEVPTDATLEEIYKGFINSCKDKLPDDQAICTWKTELGYDQCLNGLVWNGCKPQCQARCDTRGTCSNEIKEEGCFCPVGKILFADMCLDECPGQCSCDNIVKTEETLFGANQIIGDSNMFFREQWTITADVKLTHLTNELYRIPLLEMTTTEILGADDFVEGKFIIQFSKNPSCKNFFL